MPSKAPKQCFFCSQNVQQIDHENVELLRRFISAQGKIIDPRHTGVCASHQRNLAKTIKRSRAFGLMPFTRK
jgi:small subunit ribosomal protein S18